MDVLRGEARVQRPARNALPQLRGEAGLSHVRERLCGAGRPAVPGQVDVATRVIERPGARAMAGPQLEHAANSRIVDGPVRREPGVGRDQVVEGAKKVR